MYIIEVSEDKVSHLADTVGKMLHYGSKAMECIEEMREESRHHGEGRMGYREDDEPRNYDRMGERGYGRGGRYGMREEDRDYEEERMNERYPRERWDEMPPYMNERRGRSMTTGRYIRR